MTILYSIQKRERQNNKDLTIKQNTNKVITYSSSFVNVIII